MDSNKLKRTFIASAIAGMAALCAVQPAVAQQLPEKIRIGMMVTMSGPGAANEYGTMRGVQLGVQEVNKAGGIAGRQIEIVAADTAADPTTTVNEARRLVDREKVNVIIGPMVSQFTLAAAPVLNQAKIASISTSGSSDLTPKIAPYHFSIIPPADAQGRAMVDYAVTVLHAKSLAMIGDNGAQAKVAMAAAKAEAEARGVNWLGTQENRFRDTDVTPQVLALKRLNPDALLMWPNSGEDHALIIKTRDDLGWKVPTVNGGGTALNVVPAKKVYDKAYDGIPSTMLKSWTYCEGDPVGGGELVQFKQRLRNIAPNDYEKIPANYTAWTYDAVFVFKAAIEATRSVDGPILTAWIEQNADKLKVISGQLHASKDNHFLLGDPRSIAMAIDTDKPRSDGYYKRVGGC